MMKGLQFVEDNDIEYKSATATELTINVCPFCGDDRNKLYVNKETGLYDCKLCGQSGNLYQLKAKYGSLDEISQTGLLMSKEFSPLDEEKYRNIVPQLHASQEAMDYLHSRGFEDKTIDFFKLGLQGDWLLIPHYFQSKLWNFKFITFRGDKQFKRIQGQPSILFNADNIDYTKPAIVVVESETDCMAAWQMGIENVVGVTGGAKTFKPGWLKVFNKFKEVYIVLNSDVPGQEGAFKLAHKIGVPKCKNVVLPVKDVNDYLRDGMTDLKGFIRANGKKVVIKNVSTLGDYVEKIDEWFDKDGSLEGLGIPDFPQLNKLLSGFKKEDLIILIGDSGVGKTTWLLYSVLQMIREDRRCLLFCLEGKINYYILRMMCMHTGKKLEDLRDDEKEWAVLKDEFAEFPLYFYSGSQSGLDPKELADLLLAAVPLYDIEFVGIDNLQKLVKGFSDVFQRTGDAISTLKDRSVDLKVPILIISHVKKLDPKSRHNITMHDAKSSSTIFQDADIVLIINVKRDGAYEMVVEKNRMGEGGVRIPIALDKNTGRYYEADGVPGSIESLASPDKKGEGVEDDDDWLKR